MERSPEALRQLVGKGVAFPLCLFHIAQRRFAAVGRRKRIGNKALGRTKKLKHARRIRKSPRDIGRVTVVSAQMLRKAAPGITLNETDARLLRIGVNGANSLHHLPVGIERAPVKTVLEQMPCAPRAFIEPPRVRQKQPVHRRAHRVLVICKHQTHVIAHKAPGDNRHARLAAALTHQLQKLPPVVIALKEELLARTAGTDMVKAGNRSPNALHGAPFAGICLPSNTARLKRAIKTFTQNNTLARPKAVIRRRTAPLQQVNPCNAYKS